MIELKKKVDFLSTKLQEDLERMYQLCMIFDSNGPEKTLLQENYGSTMHGSHREDHYMAGEHDSASTAEITE
ncbi:hypothetical protein TNCV_2020631 [Trichonephila clavipes]|nr:hypothetical protein TNCV_2020631 [Trichonephila clavipes]